jgi:hypothetical protein
MADPRQRPIHHADTASRVFSGEAVVITPAQNTLRMFNRAGSRIWELMDGERSIEEIAVVLSQEYQVEPEEALASVLRFTDELHGKGLVAYSG